MWQNNFWICILIFTHQLFCLFLYSSHKIRKTQNEHLLNICQNLIGIKLFLIFWCLKFIYSGRPQNLTKSSTYFWLALHRTKVRWRFRKILWPSGNIWTLCHLANIWKKGLNLNLNSGLRHYNCTILLSFFSENADKWKYECTVRNNSIPLKDLDVPFVFSPTLNLRGGVKAEWQF